MHKIFTVQISYFSPPAIIIVTAYKNSGGYFKAESFCVFPEPYANENMFQVFRFESKNFANTSLELNDNFMLEEALGQARIDIGLHVQKHYADKPSYIPSELELKEADFALLAHLRVRETADFLWDIQNKTDCESLKTLIEPILALPTISRRKL